MKDSAAELEKASNVAFMVSEPIYKKYEVSQIKMCNLQFPSF